jgi:hypothetical protein|tara:strand:- start:172 stop:705 length:534 start_codon:yes stop_codon:yes gene_type:complete
MNSLTASSLNVTATLGPFGLAFPAEPRAVQRLACDEIGSRPFLTSLQAHHVSAPLGGRDVYEFRIGCGIASSPWTNLGPHALLWASARNGLAACPRPLSASGLYVSRARERTWRGGRDLYGFSLACNSEEVDALDSGDTIDERRGKRCPPGSFISAIEISRGFEPKGAYDLYEFELE